MLLGKRETLLTEEVVPFAKGLPSYGHWGKFLLISNLLEKNSR